MTEYILPKKWADYVNSQPETAMGSTYANIYFQNETLEGIAIINDTKFSWDSDLNLEDITRIKVLNREELVELNKKEELNKSRGKKP